MSVVNIHEAKTQLSRLIERVVGGESLVIAKAGKPLVRMVRLDAPDAVSYTHLDVYKRQA